MIGIIVKYSKVMAERNDLHGKTMPRMGMLLRPRPGVLRRSQRKHRPPRRMQTPCRPPAALRMLAVRHKACPLLGLLLWKRSRRPRPLITPDWTHRRWPRCTAQKISYAAPERNTSSRWPTLWVWPMMSSSEIRTGTINTAKIPLSHGANSSESAKAQPISFCRSAIFLKAVLQTSRKF